MLISQVPMLLLEPETLFLKPAVGMHTFNLRSHQIRVCHRLANHSEHWEDPLMTKPQTKASPLSTFHKKPKFNKVKNRDCHCDMQLIQSSVIPAQTWIPNKSITCHTCIWYLSILLHSR